ncbi:hypothetical protein evm_001323 [Chilo suppressalis]|nr:hypothetical protein evm_001323 [Chilo suppressalis]
MGKKAKENVKSKKERIEKKSASSKAKKNSNVNYCCSLVSGLVAVLVVFLSYKAYMSLVHVPDLPNLDLDAWWGPNDTKLNQDTSIRPFRIVFSESMLTDLRRRFDDYRRLKKTKSFENATWTYGVNSDGYGQFFSHWIFKYNFQRREQYLNKFNHFKTNVQGLDIHFIHVKPKVDEDIKVIPLLLLHGWPGSVREFYEAIHRLTSPRAGYDFVFEIIAPSLPGFGYSQAPVRPGLSETPMAIVLRNLMHRLGFKQFYVQGGDLGHKIGTRMATLFPSEVLGLHTNMAVMFTDLPILVWVFGGVWPSLVEKDYTDRLYPVEDKVNFYLEESGYLHLQHTKPDTIGVALRESPAGLAAYIVEKFVIGTDPQNKFKDDGGLDAYNADDLIDNIMIYWMTGSITTSIRIFKENSRNKEMEIDMEKIPTEVPTWALRLRHEIFFMPEFMIKWKFTNLDGTTTKDVGGHFAALEKPDIFADDVFKAVKSFRGLSKTR